MTGRVEADCSAGTGDGSQAMRRRRLTFGK